MKFEAEVLKTVVQTVENETLRELGFRALDRMIEIFGITAVESAFHKTKGVAHKETVGDELEVIDCSDSKAAEPKPVKNKPEPR